MTLETVEPRSAARRSRGSDVARQTDTPHIPYGAFAVHRIATRFGLSAEVAALLADLSGLGPREARR